MTPAVWALGGLAVLNAALAATTCYFARRCRRYADQAKAHLQHVESIHERQEAP